MKFLILHGPNLNLLGTRDPNQYGSITQDGIIELLQSIYPDDLFDLFQSNVEGELINTLQNSNSYDGIIINPAGYSHTSVAIYDSLELVKKPKVEVHLSHIAKREEFRQVHITARGCNGFLSGFKEHGYVAAVLLLKRLILEGAGD